MRFLYFLVLLCLLAAIGIFVYQNQGDVEIRYLDRSFSTTLAILVGAVYLAGMLTGWTVVGMLRRSIERVSEPAPRRTAL